ncbi:MAG: hypothetical protein HUU19_12210 [Phycisphaerales bacterium]|nr:hypothetical protein [Phycisphaerales bacterium]
MCFRRLDGLNPTGSQPGPSLADSLRSGVQGREPRGTPGASRTPFGAAPEFERLEPRSHLDTAFASVGLGFIGGWRNDSQAEAYISEGTISDLGVATGTWSVARDAGAHLVGGLPYSSITRLADGRMLRNPSRGYNGSPHEFNAARFDSAAGYNAGWWYAEYTNGTRELEFIVEQPAAASPSDLSGTWTYTLAGVAFDDNFPNNPDGTEGEGRGSSGTMTISNSLVRFQAVKGTAPRSSTTITGMTLTGRATGSHGEYFYLSKDKNTLIFADMTRGDEVFVGIAVRNGSAAAPQDLVGNYLFADVATDDYAQARGSEMESSQWVLSLESDGDYKVYDLDDYDSGGRHVISRGYWHVSGDRLTLDEDRSSGEFIFAIGRNRTTLLSLQYDDDYENDGPALGLGTRVAGPLDTWSDAPLSFTSGTPDNFGRPTLYQLGADGTWAGVDIVRASGSPSITGNLVTWYDTKDGRHHAVGLASGGVIEFIGSSRSRWIFRNLTTDVAGSAAVARGLSMMTSPDGTVSIVGLTTNGSVVRYWQSGDQDATGRPGWNFENISTEDLAPTGQTTPAFVGGLTAYATRWNGLNIAGIDSSGNVWSVWWAPGRSAWSVSNLTQTLGGVPVRGGLTVYLTSWDGINIAGLDDHGHMQVTWWVPSFGGTWKQDNLTITINAPALRAGTITSYVSTWDGLNIVGIDDTTGKTCVYWWSPTNVSVGWQATILSDIATDENGMTLPVNELRGVASSDGGLSVMGVNNSGELVRYYWKQEFFGAWRAQNVAQMAVRL